MNSLNRDILTDCSVLEYIQKNIHLVDAHFDVPDGVSPTRYIIELSNEALLAQLGKLNIGKEKELTYRLPTIYTYPGGSCIKCTSALKTKRHIESVLYDDVHGSNFITIISKYCKNCKLTYYPGLIESYADQNNCEEIFHEYTNDWSTYPIFISTTKTSFSMDMMNQLICMKMKCHSSFIGKVEAYNMHHKYDQLEGEEGKARLKLNKKRLTEAYFRFTLLNYKQRYGITPLSIINDIDDQLKQDYPILYAKFQENYGHHVCAITGCEDCLVIDGHMKAHRKVCRSVGCRSDPAFKNIFCKEHANTEVRKNVDGVQELKSDDEHHIERIIKKVRKKTKTFYEVAWVGSDTRTQEPREHIPRILVELFDRYGDSNLPVTTQDRCVINNTKYINVHVNEKDMFTLPSSSMVLDPNAYLVKPIEDEENTSCNTIKTKNRFYARTGGILVMAKPCGVIVAIAEIIGGESVTQVATVIEDYLTKSSSRTKCLLYDDACHLSKHVRCRCVYPLLANLEMKIDKFHFKNHTDSWCIENMNPNDSQFLKDVNTEVMEQIFSWFKGFSSSLKYMKSCRFNFFILDMIDRHNSLKLRKPQTV